MKFKTPYLGALAAAALLAGTANAQFAEDEAGNVPPYAAWDMFDNGGVGFNPWILSTQFFTPTIRSTHYATDATNFLGGSPLLNSIAPADEEQTWALHSFADGGTTNGGDAAESIADRCFNPNNQNIDGEVTIRLQHLPYYIPTGTPFPDAVPNTLAQDEDNERARFQLLRGSIPALDLFVNTDPLSTSFGNWTLSDASDPTGTNTGLSGDTPIQVTAFFNAGSNLYDIFIDDLTAGAPMHPPEIFYGSRIQANGRVGFPECIQLQASSTQVANSTPRNSVLLANFIGRDGITTAIELESLEASVSGGTATIDWTTSAEVDNAGFNVYAASALAGGGYEIGEAVNASIIPAEGNGTGATYSISTSTVADAYFLEDIDLSGETTIHGPAVVGGDKASTDVADWHLFN